MAKTVGGNGSGGGDDVAAVAGTNGGWKRRAGKENHFSFCSTVVTLSLDCYSRQQSVGYCYSRSTTGLRKMAYRQVNSPRQMLGICFCFLLKLAV